MHDTSPWPPDFAGTLTQWPWPIFCAQLTLTQFVDVPDLLNYKAYNYQTLHSASPRCTDSAYTLTQWPWPIFCAPVTLTHFASTFNISSTLRPTTIKPWKVLLLNVLTQQIPWPGNLDLYFGYSGFDEIYVNVPDLLKCKTSRHQTLHSASPRCTDSAGILTRWPWPIFCTPVTWTHFASTFDISSTIRPTTIKPYRVLLLNVLTRQIPWPGDHDLYFGYSDFDIIYVNVPDLLKCKTSSHQTLHSASHRCTDSAGILTRWPWPIFCTPVPFTHFTSTFNISSTIRPTTTKPCTVLLLNVRTPQVPWLGDLDLYFALHWLLHLLRRPSVCPQR